MPAEIQPELERFGRERRGELPNSLAFLAFAPAGGPAGLQVAVDDAGSIAAVGADGVDAASENGEIGYGVGAAANGGGL